MVHPESVLKYSRFFFSLLCFSSALYAREEAPWDLLLRYLPPNPLILEAGAHDGTDTEHMSHLWKEGTIHAFEPYPEIYECLEKVAETHSNIYTYPFALTHFSGKAPFYLAGGASSLLVPAESFNRDYFHADLDAPIQVECVTIDQWAQKLAIRSIDFMWLDMEGNELHALKGAEQILKNTQLIYTEVNFQRFWEDCVTYEDLKSWLEDRGFVEVWSEVTPNWHGNVLFMNQNFRSLPIHQGANLEYETHSLD